MFDNRSVTTDMEELFGRSARPSVAQAIAWSEPNGSMQTSGRRSFTARDGMATIAFAITAALIGLIALPLLKPSPGVETRVSPPTITPGIPAPVITRTPMAANPPINAIPPVANPPRRSAKRKPAVRHQMAIVRKARPARTPRGTPGAPYLTGAALRRALAQDAIVTRRLNLEALRKLPPA